MRLVLARPWVWSFVGALLVWLASIAFTRGYGAGGMLTAGLALAVFSVIVGTGQMFVITLGPGNVDLSLPANIGLASAVAMKVMDGSDAMVPAGILAIIFTMALYPDMAMQPTEQEQETQEEQLTRGPAPAPSPRIFA